MKSQFLFFANGKKGNQESMAVLFYQFHNILICLLEDRALYNHMLLINLLKLLKSIKSFLDSFCQR